MRNGFKAMKKYLLASVAVLCAFFCAAVRTYAADTQDVPLDGSWVTQTMLEDGDAGMLRWRLTVPSDGRMDVTVQAFRNATYWCLYNEDQTVRYHRGQINEGSLNSPTSQDKTWYLSKGVYYITAADNGANFYGGDGDVRLKASFVSAETTENEPNNTWKEANPLAADTKVRGILTEHDDREDFYQIQVQKEGEVTFKLTSMFSWCKLLVYDADYNQIFRKVLTGDETSPAVGEGSMDLKEGTYFLKITDDLSNGDPSGIYELSWSWKAPYVAVSSVSLDKKTMELTKMGQTETLHATVAPEDATDKSIAWSSDNPAVAKVSNGTVSAVSNGTARIQVLTNDRGFQDVCEVTVAIPTLADAEVKLPKSTYAYTGKAVTPAPTVTYNGQRLQLHTDYTVTYKNNQKVGNAVITVRGKGGYIGEKSVSFRIQVDTSKAYTVGNLKYKITSASHKTAMVTGMKSPNKSSATIPSTVKILGTAYKVERIHAKAFQGNKKLKALVIGGNVKTVDAKAFTSCSKLAKITVKSKALKKVGSNALKGTKKNIRIEAPKKYFAKYKKLFEKKGQSKVRLVKK